MVRQAEILLLILYKVTGPFRNSSCMTHQLGNVPDLIFEFWNISYDQRSALKISSAPPPPQTTESLTIAYNKWNGNNKIILCTFLLWCKIKKYKFISQEYCTFKLIYPKRGQFNNRFVVNKTHVACTRACEIAAHTCTYTLDVYGQKPKNNINLH